MQVVGNFAVYARWNLLAVLVQHNDFDTPFAHREAFHLRRLVAEGGRRVSPAFNVIKLTKS